MCKNLTESYILSLADRLVNTGLASLGYVYVNIDDCWQIGRDPKTGVLQVDPLKFPHGMKYIGDEIHKRGLKLGLYTDRGKYTCQRRPGSRSFEVIDAQTFAKWGVDYLKEDSCYATSIFHKEAFREYALMRDALNKTNRPIFFSICGWNPWYAPVGSDLGNSWRISPDNTRWNSVYAAARQMEILVKYSGPGGWNDPDFILGSNTTGPVFLTPKQSRTQFSLWTIMSAPLMLSGPDALNKNSFDFQTFSNPIAIQINQDVVDKTAKVIFSTCPKFWLPAWTAPFDRPAKGCTQIWFKGPLSFNENSVALVFVNWDSTETQQVSCDNYCMRLAGIPRSASIVSIQDVWASEDNGGNVLNSRSSNIKLIKDIDGNFGGPGRIETTLDSEGGSAYLIVEWEPKADDDDHSDGGDDDDAVTVGASTADSGQSQQLIGNDIALAVA
jgi:alpha-galactosidase